MNKIQVALKRVNILIQQLADTINDTPIGEKNNTLWVKHVTDEIDKLIDEL